MAEQQETRSSYRRCALQFFIKIIWITQRPTRHVDNPALNHGQKISGFLVIDHRIQGLVGWLLYNLSPNTVGVMSPVVVTWIADISRRTSGSKPLQLTFDETDPTSCPLFCEYKPVTRDQAISEAVSTYDDQVRRCSSLKKIHESAASEAELAFSLSRSSD